MKIYTDELVGACVQDLKKYSEEIASLPNITFDELDKKTTALVIVDIVNGFIREGAMASPDIESIIAPSAQLAKRFSDENMPIAAFADCHKKGCAEFASFPEHCLDGTAESELVDELKNIPNITLIKKNSTNGFHEDAFRDFLKEHSGVTNFVVIGDCTDICVLQFCLSLKTYFNRENRICSILVPINCVETYNAPYHNGILMNLASYKLMSDCGIKFVQSIK
jgi:nicotinamidase-related amidase